MKIFRALGMAAILTSLFAADFNGNGFEANACSRVVFIGDSIDGHSGLVMVGRTLDWKNPIPTSLYVYPRGLQRQSMPSGPMLKWTSKYGSVMAVSYDGGVTEGMNEKGLVMNSLFCKDAIYAVQKPGGDVPVMSMAVLISYFLDNFQTVQEVQDWFAAGNRFVINAQSFDGGTAALLHFAITDRTGDTLIMEYVNGDLTMYSGRENIVLTNDPVYPKMLAIEGYWESVGGKNFLPGGVRSTDRFMRAHYFINHVPKNSDDNVAFAALSSIMGTVSVPYGYLIQGEPNVSSTQWRSIADATNGKYHFKFAYTPGDFYVDLGRLQLHPGAPVLKLDTKNPESYFGCINDKLIKTKPFNPMW